MVRLTRLNVFTHIPGMLRAAGWSDEGSLAPQKVRSASGESIGLMIFDIACVLPSLAGAGHRQLLSFRDFWAQDPQAWRLSGGDPPVLALC